MASAGPCGDEHVREGEACSARVQSKEVPAAGRRPGDGHVAEHIGHRHFGRLEERPRVERHRQQEPVVAVAQGEVQHHQRRRGARQITSVRTPLVRWFSSKGYRTALALVTETPSSPNRE